MWYMGEQEKYEQVGRAVGEYSRLKGEKAHYEAKLSELSIAYGNASSVLGQKQVAVTNGKFAFVSKPGGGAYNPGAIAALDRLLGASDLRELIGEYTRIQNELGEATQKLRELAPHLL